MTKTSIVKGLFAVVMAVGAVVPGSAQVFDKGDRKVDLTVGVGVVAYKDKSRPTFDQHASMEWGVASVADKFTIGVGFQVNNSYGGKLDGLVAGSYDYSYMRHDVGKTYSYKDKKWHPINEHKEVHRKGFGTAEATVAREDVDVLATVSLHFSPMSRLDTYLKLGAGVGYMSYIYGNYRNEQGFSSADYDKTSESKVHQSHTSFSYNDLDHVKWEGGDSKIVPALGVYLGATYMLTDRWGVDAQVGLVSANIKNADKGYPNSYGVFALGVSYRF